MRRDDESLVNRLTTANRLWPWLIQLWIASVLFTFFVVRVFGSTFGQRVLSFMGLKQAS